MYGVGRGCLESPAITNCFSLLNVLPMYSIGFFFCGAFPEPKVDSALYCMQDNPYKIGFFPLSMQMLHLSA